MSDGKQPNEDGVATITAEPQHLHLRLHAWLDLAQTSHGVRHDDYKQYHGYCTRRLSRLRHSDPSMKRYMLHSSKYQGKSAAAAGGGAMKSSASSGGGGKSKSGGGQQRNQHAYCPINEQHTQEIQGQPLQQEQLLWILLVQAERAWAQACELKQEHHQHMTSKQRSHVLRRLKKAQSYAQELHDLATCQDGNVTALTLLEIRTYLSWLTDDV
mmetsp:Transcript_19413/g.54909  ORF Transcript_19413/g.54909 Transcript_19413/m.54909 type:complete len:213 (-) Transcript_19413:322-960(-)